MTTRELHESKLIDRAWKELLDRVHRGELLYPHVREAFAIGHRAGYDEGLKWQDNKKQLAASQLKEILNAHQHGLREFPTFDELVAVMRGLEGDASPTTFQGMERFFSNPGASRARLISRLQACVDDPMWPDHAEVSKKLLEACLSVLVNPLSE